MGAKTILLNALFALFLALPLTVMEGHYSYSQVDCYVPINVRIHHNPDIVELGIKDISPGLIESIGQKIAKNSGPKIIKSRYDPYIHKIASSHGVSPALVKAVIHVESNFNPNAVSPVGAVGLMQVMPATARRLGVTNPLDPKSNIVAGVKYLKSLLDMFEDDETLALAAYNSGPSRVHRYKGVPPYKETQDFIERVMSYYRSYLNS